MFNHLPLATSLHGREISPCVDCWKDSKAARLALVPRHPLALRHQNAELAAAGQRLCTDCAEIGDLIMYFGTFGVAAEQSISLCPLSRIKLYL